MAEREGFEPSMGDKAHTPLAGERLQPLGHLSEKILLYLFIFMNLFTITAKQHKSIKKLKIPKLN